MGYPCVVCADIDVTVDGATCAGCEDEVEEAEKALVAGELEIPLPRRKKGPPTTPMSLLRRDCNIMDALQERVERSLRANNKRGVPIRGDEKALAGIAFQVVGKTCQLADTIRKYEDEDRERAKKKTSAERFAGALNYLESGKVSPQQREEAIARLAKVNRGGAS